MCVREIKVSAYFGQGEKLFAQPRVREESRSKWPAQSRDRKGEKRSSAGEELALV